MRGRPAAHRSAADVGGQIIKLAWGVAVPNHLDGLSSGSWGLGRIFKSMYPAKMSAVPFFMVSAGVKKVADRATGDTNDGEPERRKTQGGEKTPSEVIANFNLKITALQHVKPWNAKSGDKNRLL